VNIVIDTCVWSLVLRRRRRDFTDPWVRGFYACIERDDAIFLLGPILQELLDGLRSQGDFERLVEALSRFPLLDVGRQTYIFAARLRNDCRSKGIEVGLVDSLIAAACIEHGYPLLSADTDFVRIAKHCDLILLPPAGAG